MKDIAEITDHLLYGDIYEMTLGVLREHCPAIRDYSELDEEQRVRMACAATVQAWLENRLHKEGFLFDLIPLVVVRAMRWRALHQTKDLMTPADDGHVPMPIDPPCQTC